MVQEKKKIPSFVMLMLVAVVMSFAIAGVYMLTKDTIAAAALEAQAAARAKVMPEAAVMTEYALAEDAPLDWLYEAYDGNGAFIGFVGQITVVGFGGEIEVTVGMDTGGAITGISVGGSNFSETSGLGAKTRDPGFTEQFKGMSGMLVLKQNIDSVSGASISSGAVVSGVNRAVAYMTALLPEGSVSAAAEPIELTAEEIAALLPGASYAEWMGAGSGIDGWWQGDVGYIVRATGFGEGPIAVTMGFDESGIVTGILIGDENFMESEGRGALILEEAYWSQFIGRSGAQSYGDDLDAISGATVTSDAALAAINACMSFDPVSGASAAPVEVSSDEPDAVTEASIPEEEAETSAEPDAVAEASVPAEEAAVIPEPGPEPEPDAVTEASIPEEEPVHTPVVITLPRYQEPADAVTEASIPETEPTPAPEPAPDAVTEASVPEEG